MAHWDPIHDLVNLQERMNRLFENATQRRSREDEAGEQEIERADWFPAADVFENESEFVVAVDLPGIDRAGLEISLDHDRLLIRGAREMEDTGRHRHERPHGKFLRKFGVPALVDQGAITADYKDGVLKVHLPKRSEQQARRVEIKIQ